MDRKKKKMYMGGGKMKPMYLKGGQVKLDANKDGEITGLDFKMLKEMKEKMMAKGGKMEAVYNEGGKVGDPEKKKEAMKLIALNEADYDNNLGDYFRAGEMREADSVRKVMMDRFNRIVELGYGKLAEDSLPYNSLTSMNAYTELVQKQREQERGKKAPMGPFPRGVDTDGVKEKKMRPIFNK